MIIMWYTVRAGDSLYTIAQRYGVSVQQLIAANNIPPNNALYIGQLLYIPIPIRQPATYVVQSGDSLYSIARRFNTTEESIMVLNNLTGTALSVGQRLVVPQYTEAVVTVDSAVIRTGPGQNYPVIARMTRNAKLQVIGESPGWYRVRLHNGRDAWISRTVVTRNVYDSSKPITGILGFYTLEEGPTLPSSYNTFVNHAPLISETGLFLYRISANNPTQIEKFGEFTDQDINTLVTTAHLNNMKILPVVHNLLYRPGGTDLAKRVVHVLVSNPQNRSAFIQNIINLIQQYNFDGVNIDIEDVNLEDSAGVSALYTELGEALHRRGYYLSASVPSRVSDQPTNPFSAPFNYSAIGKAVDQFVAMLYNEHGWPGSGPGPVVSIGWMEQVLRYTLTKMPASKVVAAVSVFGFDFNLTTERNTYATYQMAMDLARRYNKEVIFDEKTQTPMFAYQDEQGNQHEVWFENSASLLAKIRLAWDLGISGVALWRLGMEDPDVWNMLARDVVVRRFF